MRGNAIQERKEINGMFGTELYQVRKYIDMEMWSHGMAWLGRDMKTHV